MKLYEAIRLGAMLRPQAFGALSKDGGTCAIGAAMDAIGLLPAHWSPPCITAALANFPFAGEAVVHPQREMQFPGLVWFVDEIIANLNDWHRWTREQIADWLQPIEDAWWAQRESEMRANNEIQLDTAKICSSP